MIDAAEPRVGRDEFVRELGDGFHKNHLPQRREGKKPF
jgi:hypothetical protein